MTIRRVIEAMKRRIGILNIRLVVTRYSRWTPQDHAYMAQAKATLPEFEVIAHRKYVDEVSHSKSSGHLYHPLTHQEASGCYIADQVRQIFSRCAAQDPLRVARVLDIGSPLLLSMGLSATPHVRFEMLDVRSHPQRSALPFLLVQGDMAQLPYPDSSFDLVTSGLVLLHLGEARYDEELDPGKDVKALKELARVIRPGGSLVFVPGALMRGRPTVLYNIARVYTPQWLTQRLIDVGFTITRFVCFQCSTGSHVTECELPTSAGKAVADPVLACITARRR